MNPKDDPCGNEWRELIEAVKYYEKHENKKLKEKLKILQNLSDDEIKRMANDPTYSPKGLEDWLVIANERLQKATREYLDCRKKRGWPK